MSAPKGERPSCKRCGFNGTPRDPATEASFHKGLCLTCSLNASYIPKEER